MINNDVINNEAKLAVNDDLNVSLMFYIMGQRKVQIAISTLLMAVLFVAISFAVTTRYEAQVVVKNVDQSKNTLSLPQGLSAFSSLAGLSNNNDKELSVIEMNSRRFTEYFIEKEKLFTVLFHEYWDEEKQIWLDKKKGLRDYLPWSDFKEGPANPNHWEAFKKFDDVRNIGISAKSGAVTVKILWHDPQEAADIANSFVARFNEYMKAEMIEQSQKRIAYLEQLSEQNITQALHAAIVRGLNEEINTVANLNASDDVVFKVIDPAVIPEEKASPIRLLYLITGLLLGFLVNVLHVFILHRKVLLNKE